MRLLVLISSCLGVANGFCEDGINIPQLVEQGDVIITWAQAPLFSTNPQINQTGKYLNLFHTALVFRQDEAYWTMEFDAVADDLSHTVLPLISADGKELSWRNTDARWCLRTGIFNGRDHWTTNFVDVANVSAVQLLQLLDEFIPTVNSTVPGAWPQYQFWRVQSYFTGDIPVDDTTCGHVFRVLGYIRDVLLVPLLDMKYEATRVTLPSLGTTEVNMSDPEQKQDVMNFYITLSKAVGGKGGVDAFQAIFQFFLPWQFVYDPIAQKYFKLNWGAPGEIILLLYVRFEAVGDLLPPPGSECDVSPSCAAVMAMHSSYGMGEACKASLGSMSEELIGGGCHADATDRARDIDCFCGNQCYVESDCLAEMSNHCGRGGGRTCKNCMILAFPKIALFGPCEATWGHSKVMDKGRTRACFCDESQWQPDKAEFLLA